ncbi:hypothetical protein [Marinagarivorans algicola]|uniref:hypothetical protein n=1 Tax=Marinagarivorans algicola TaxID=1513270 RepID=UPI0006B5205A|nr:hypothetical protein [Marinagarivorans algicola]
MNKLAVLLLATVMSQSALASEVGAKNPQVIKPATLAYTVADTGANESEWAIGPVNTPVTVAQHKRMVKVVDKFNDEISNKLALKLERALESK